MEVYKKVADYIAQSRLDISHIAAKSTIPEADVRAMLNGTSTMDGADLRKLCLAMNVSPELFIEAPFQEPTIEKGTSDHE